MKPEYKCAMCGDTGWLHANGWKSFCPECNKPKNLDAPKDTPVPETMTATYRAPQHIRNEDDQLPFPGDMVTEVWKDDPLNPGILLKFASGRKLHVDTVETTPKQPTLESYRLMPFSVGDTVRLKSGGPAMCVRDMLPGNYVIVDWFDDATPQQKAFLAPMLELVATPPSSGKHAAVEVSVSSDGKLRVMNTGAVDVDICVRREGAVPLEDTLSPEDKKWVGKWSEVLDGITKPAVIDGHSADHDAPHTVTEATPHPFADKTRVIACLDRGVEFFKSGEWSPVTVDGNHCVLVNNHDSSDESQTFRHVPVHLVRYTREAG